jgi:hypothetical protein
VVIDFRVEAEEAVYPMVPAGAALDAMIRRPQVPDMEFDEICSEVVKWAIAKEQWNDVYLRKEEHTIGTLP